MRLLYANLAYAHHSQRTVHVPAANASGATHRALTAAPGSNVAIAGTATPTACSPNKAPSQFSSRRSGRRGSAGPL